MIGHERRDRAALLLMMISVRGCELTGAMVNVKWVRPLIDRTYSVDDIRAGHMRLESNETFGKVVLLVG